MRFNCDRCVSPSGLCFGWFLFSSFSDWRASWPGDEKPLVHAPHTNRRERRDCNRRCLRTGSTRWGRNNEEIVRGGVVIGVSFLVAACGKPAARTGQPAVAEVPVTPFSKDWPYGAPSSFAQRKALIDHGTLHDGMRRAEAETLLGPPTGERNGVLEWYHNPEHRWHVAACFRAEVRDGKLYNWSTGNR
jgi:hypothetical protein